MTKPQGLTEASMPAPNEYETGKVSIWPAMALIQPLAWVVNAPKNAFIYSKAATKESKTS